MHHFLRSSFVPALLAIVPLATAGCSSSDSGPRPEIYETVAASGILTYKGLPLANYQVTFFQEGKRPAQGMTDASGKFTLGTNATGDGAPPGKYKVTVAFAAQSPLDIAAATAEQIMKSTPRPKVKIPAKYVRREKSELVIEVPEQGSSDLKVELNS
jgi:hypothetical protein